LLNIKVITIDLDDTLWDIDPVIHEAEAKLWDWLSQNYPRITQIYNQQKILDLRLNVANKYPEKAFDYRFMRKLILREIFKRAGYLEEYAEEAFKVFDIARNNVKLYDGAQETLELLGKHFKLIAITNGNADLNKIGLRHLFYDVVTAVDVGFAKPDKRIFQEAIKKSKVNTEEIIHVGDNPEADILGAANVGLGTVWMNSQQLEWPKKYQKPDMTIVNISELCNLLIPKIN
tara:strand:- start:1900 stop:2595 length:696 start_codon:yes stop_codon:yes gene_type:complete